MLRTRVPLILSILNYREKLWAPIGGLKKAQQTLRQIVSNVDVLIGNEEDLQLGLGIPGLKATSKSKFETKSFFEMIKRVVEKFPNIKMSEVEAFASGGSARVLR